MYKVSKNTKIITIFLQKVGSLLLNFTMLLLLILFDLGVLVQKGFTLLVNRMKPMSYKLKCNFKNVSPSLRSFKFHTSNSQKNIVSMQFFNAKKPRLMLQYTNGQLLYVNEIFRSFFFREKLSLAFQFP